MMMMSSSIWNWDLWLFINDNVRVLFVFERRRGKKHMIQLMAILFLVVLAGSLWASDVTRGQSSSSLLHKNSQWVWTFDFVGREKEEMTTTLYGDVNHRLVRMSIANKAIMRQFSFFIFRCRRRVGLSRKSFYEKILILFSSLFSRFQDGHHQRKGL